VARRQTIADGLHRTAQRLPAKTAIVCGSTRWSYAEFNALVSRLAAVLQRIYIGSSNVITAKPTPDNLLPLLEQHQITSFFAPPTVWIALLRSPLFDAGNLSHLTKGYYRASIMPVAVLQELASRLPAVRLWNLYGQTEIAPLATMLAPVDHLRKPGSCGKAVLNVETQVVNDAMQDVAVGELGEIVHRSPHLMLDQCQGYIG